MPHGGPPAADVLRRGGSRGVCARCHAGVRGGGLLCGRAAAPQVSPPTLLVPEADNNVSLVVVVVVVVAV